MMEWIAENRVSLLWMGGASVLFMAAMMIVGPVVIVRMPADYLQRNGGGVGGKGGGTSGGGKPAWRIARNILGWLLIAGGIAMLALPGPGVLVLILGITLADFPGKQRLLRWILSRGKILQSANRLRARYGRPPLQVSHDAGQPRTA